MTASAPTTSPAQSQGPPHEPVELSTSRYPLVLTVAGCIAMVALYLTASAVEGGRFAGTLVLAGAAACSYVFGARLPDRFLVRWGARTLAWAAILTILGVPDQDVSLWYVKPEYMTRVGPLLAAEFALRAWLAKPASRAARNWSEGLFLTSLIFIPATTTFDRDIIPWIAPIYTAAALLTLRRIARLETSPTTTPRPIRWSVSAQRLGLALITLLMGFGVVTAVTVYDRQVTAWAMKILQGQFDKSDASNSEIGLSTTPILQGIFNPAPSMDRALILDGPQGERHLRVFAFDTYDGRQWGPPVSERKFAAVDSRSLRLPSVPGKSMVTALRIQPLTDRQAAYLAVPTESATLTADVPLERDPYGMLRPIKGERPTGWTIESPGGEGNTIPLLSPLPTPPSAATRPTATPDPASPEPLTPPRDDIAVAALFLPPAIDAEVIQLGQAVAGDGPPLARVFRISAYLRSTHAYSLSFTPMPGTDPLNDFILNKRAAHCQYFASAMVVLARSAGVPARFVTGYYAHEPIPGGGTMVRERDAHAWAECWVDGVGWVLVDPTPAGGRPDAIFPPPTSAQRFWEALIDLPSQAREWLAQGGITRVLLFTTITISAILTLRWLLAARRRRRATSTSGLPAPDPRLLTIAARFDRLLNTAAIPPAPTWRERLSCCTSSTDLTEFLSLYDRARFNDETEVIPQLHSLLHRLQSQPPITPVNLSSAAPPSSRPT